MQDCHPSHCSWVGSQQAARERLQAKWNLAESEAWDAADEARFDDISMKNMRLCQQVDELLLAAMPLEMSRIFVCHAANWFRAHANLVVHDSATTAIDLGELFSMGDDSMGQAREYVGGTGAMPAFFLEGGGVCKAPDRYTGVHQGRE